MTPEQSTATPGQTVSARPPGPATDDAPRPSRRVPTWAWDAAVAVGLALLIGFAFRPALDADFIDFDDPDYVTANEQVLKGLTVPGVVWAFTTTHAANWHPLTWLSFMADVSLFGTGPEGFHATNVVLHALASVLLYLALRLMTGAVGRSALVAALFAVHPLHVESVAWVSERKDILCAVFWMLTLLAYGWYVRRASVGRYLLVAAGLALALLAKPMAVTLPCVLLLLDWWPLRRLGDWAAVRRAVLEKAPLVGVVAAACVATVLAQSRGGAVAQLDHLPLSVRVMNASSSYVGYLGKTVWPTRLALFYPMPQQDWLRRRVVPSVVLLAAVTAAAWWTRRRRPYVAVGWLWYLGTLVPVIGLMQVGSQGMADRYTYLPLVGVFLMAAWGAADLVRGRRWAAAAAAAAAVAVLAGCVWLTQFQCWLWQAPARLWNYTLQVTERNAKAHFSMANAYLKEGALDKAASHYTLSLELASRNPDAHFNLGTVLLRQGQLDGAGEHFARATELSPRLDQAWHGRGRVLSRQGRYHDAAAMLEKAVEINPRVAAAWDNLGTARVGAGQWPQAVEAYRTAVELNPESPAFRANLAWALARTGQGLEAEAEYARVRDTGGDWVDRTRQTAWNYATAHADGRRSGFEAVRLAEQVSRVTEDRDPACLDVLAAAYAEAGRFPDAAAAAKRALALPEPPPGLAGRHALYEARKPYRQDR